MFKKHHLLGMLAAICMVMALVCSCGRQGGQSSISDEAGAPNESSASTDPDSSGTSGQIPLEKRTMDVPVKSLGWKST